MKMVKVENVHKAKCNVVTPDGVKIPYGKIAEVQEIYADCKHLKKVKQTAAEKKAEAKAEAEAKAKEEEAKKLAEEEAKKAEAEAKKGEKK
jgi:hypothetical protein